MPGVTRRDGPPQKVGYSFVGEGGPKRGDVKHSAEGFWTGIHAELDKLSRRASWHFTVGFDRTEQHYVYTTHCWHAGDTDDDGGVAANIDLVGIEHLGMKGTPLTPYQIDMTARISAWCAEQEGRSEFERFTGWAPDRPAIWTLTEHNEVSNVPTACPSGRIPWDSIMTALAPASLEEDDMALIITLDGNRKYLVRGCGEPEHIPSPTVREELAKLYGISKEPVTVSPEVFNFLKGAS